MYTGRVHSCPLSIETISAVGSIEFPGSVVSMQTVVVAVASCIVAKVWDTPSDDETWCWKISTPSDSAGAKVVSDAIAEAVSDVGADEVFGADGAWEAAGT